MGGGGNSGCIPQQLAEFVIRWIGWLAHGRALHLSPQRIFWRSQRSTGLVAVRLFTGEGAFEIYVLFDIDTLSALVVVRGPVVPLHIGIIREISTSPSDVLGTVLVVLHDGDAKIIRVSAGRLHRHQLAQIRGGIRIVDMALQVLFCGITWADGGAAGWGTARCCRCCGRSGGRDGSRQCRGRGGGCDRSRRCRGRSGWRDRCGYRRRIGPALGWISAIANLTGGALGRTARTGGQTHHFLAGWAGWGC